LAKIESRVDLQAGVNFLDFPLDDEEIRITDGAGSCKPAHCLMPDEGFIAEAPDLLVAVQPGGQPKRMRRVRRNEP
jgi:hypothetical protein